MSDNYNVLIHVRANRKTIPSYRIWIDDELMLERSFWPDSDKHYIEENMIVEFSHNTRHSIRLEQIDMNAGFVWMDGIFIRTLEKRMVHEVKMHSIDEPSQIFNFSINT